MELPGASVPPEAIWTLPTVPVPPSVPPLLTVVAPAMEPLTDRVPALTRVGPV